MDDQRQQQPTNDMIEENWTIKRTRLESKATCHKTQNEQRKDNFHEAHDLWQTQIVRLFLSSLKPSTTTENDHTTKSSIDTTRF